jgi:uncharacterized membrane protein
MKQIVGFVKATVVGGIVVILPIALAILLILQALKILHQVVDPVAGAFGFRETFLATIATVVLLVSACFLVGLAMRTAIGVAVRDALERIVLNRVPGYSELRAVARSFAGIEKSRYPSALVDLYCSDAWQPALVVEERGETVAVYVPVAPAFTVGLVYVVRRERVRLGAGGMAAAVKVIRQFGVGSLDLVDSPNPAPATVEAAGR